MTQNALRYSTSHRKYNRKLSPLTFKRSPAKQGATQKTRLKQEMVNTTFITCLK